MGDEDDTVHYDGTEGGWGSIKGMAEIAWREKPTPAVLNTLRRQNKVKGFMCVSCAWTKPAHPHAAEFCENGAKATLWELTSRRCTPEVLARHKVGELRTWKDHDLEQLGRLTHPMRFDRASDRYVPCSWEEAFEAIGRELKAIDPRAAVFYSSGRASLETSYLYALFARAYGHNNLPDSSNMCHETTSVALKKLIGSPVGTCVLADFDLCDAIFFFGQNTGSNSPRLLHPLQEAVKRGVKIVTFNPIREKGLEVFKNPQSPTEMLTPKATQISTLYLQVKAGGDIAAITGLIKHVLAEEERKWREEQRHVLDIDFIEQHCTGFEALKAHVEATGWEEIERESGLARADLRQAAQIYIDAPRSIAMYGMGLTQHVHGFENLAALTNLWLLKGNIGRDGTGISPVRGHSNVQGQRTVGISEKPELVPLDRIARQYGFDPPREEGMNTVKACEKILSGEVKAFIGLGGNFVRAIPEREKMEAAWQRLRLTVQIATKLNRSHLINGEIAYLLPCLGRSEEDMQASGPQAVTMEDSLSCIHGSLGKNKPASDHLKSEVAIVAGMAKATLPPNPKLEWDAWTADYARIRDRIEESYPDQFHDFNDRVFTPGGFYRGNSARERIWKTESGKAQFTVPKTMSSVGFEPAVGRYRLVTLRSNDQFNTTIYGYSDRLRGIEGTRDVVLMNPEDMGAAGLREGQVVSLASDAGDGVHRQVDGLAVTPFLLPRGCLGAYYPEMNPLVPLWYHDEQSKTPAAKGVPVRIVI
ncbi:MULTISPECIES: FdhF/YdeP family oxidoreductase [Sphingobium]|uniref:Molybdopterin-containing oxidoreductase formate dehydrogenase n=1 Tax=Sphingobium fuliginis (strain ATCC 27551) TaxID=336203 RepID=A0ABQ1EWI4_SPHSA|nr:MULTISPECIES: FdhF/YdeP family oxidoreductase [Sphingobium]MCB4860358.1 FdhF/YdeP family oxidoreductase [Sphingobium sp. PNB]RYL98284.1 FdhF/YdeP family oxidoreductase [Sphingobium fuliginis]WDA35404.1 FdhF/YdeP family oxidoreductase [Sphingobium sp. YC-XJ3]GFZ90381.1 molybdopterin-containing oxidoreductase formate dehydrogenase [Sphingobium fuliginis]